MSDYDGAAMRATSGAVARELYERFFGKPILASRMTCTALYRIWRGLITLLPRSIARSSRLVRRRFRNPLNNPVLQSHGPRLRS